jgi:hypothetical protein
MAPLPCLWGASLTNNRHFKSMNATELANSLSQEQAAAVKELLAGKEQARIAAVVACEKQKTESAAQLKEAQTKSSEEVATLTAERDALTAQLTNATKLFLEGKHDEIEALIVEKQKSAQQRQRDTLHATIAKAQADLDAIQSEE